MRSASAKLSCSGRFQKKCDKGSSLEQNAACQTRLYHLGGLFQTPLHHLGGSFQTPLYHLHPCRRTSL